MGSPEPVGPSGLTFVSETRHAFALCAAGPNCGGQHWDQVYSTLHASDLGWVYTDSPKFREPGKESVWVCPTCAAKYKWTQRRS